MSFYIMDPKMLLVGAVFLGIAIFAYLYFKKKSSKRLESQRPYLWSRCIIAILIVFAISGLCIRWTNKMTTTIFLVDVSESTNAYSTDLTEYVKSQLAQMPKNNQAGVVAFGKSASVEQFISQKNTFTELTSGPIKTATNMEEAFRYASALIPSDTAKRIVLITDGQENTGDLTNLSGTLAEDNIELNVVKFSGSQSTEMYVDELSIPENIRVGELFTIEVTVKSNVAGKAKLWLYSGRTTKGSREVSLQKGENKFIFEDKQTEVGIKNYRVVLETANGKDTIDANNEYVAYTNIDIQQQVLVVEGKDKEADKFVQVLDSIGMKYQLRQPNTVPTTISEMNQYKGIILVNTHRDDLSNEFMSVIESYVKDFGGMVVATGGDNSFALGNYKDTSLEKVLPVDMELKGKKKIPKMAITLVMDHSGSMGSVDGGTVSKMTLAKQAAVMALDTLRKKDELGILEFDHSYKWVFKPQMISDREKLEKLIGGITANGGTSIYPAMVEAEAKMKSSDAKIKHIILISDGQSEFNDTKGLMDKLKKEKITVSTVAIGTGADTNLLTNLATVGGGRAYYTDYASNLPRIFAQEIYRSAGKYLVNREFVPAVTSTSELLNGVTEKGLPSLLGYIASTPKTNAKVLLVSDEEDPILSTYQYGIGRTIAWNSDVSNQWSANYAGQKLYQTMWSNLLKWGMEDIAKEGSAVSVKDESGELRIQYQTKEFREDSNVYATVQDDEGKETRIQLSPSSAGEYQGSVNADHTGVYTVNVSEKEKGDVISSITTSGVVQYSKEYKVFDVNRGFDQKIKNLNGNLIKKTKNVFSTHLKAETGRINLAGICLLLAMILFVVDVFFRRLQLLNYIRNYIRFIIQESRKRIVIKKKEKNSGRESLDYSKLVNRNQTSKGYSATTNTTMESDKLKGDKGSSYEEGINNQKDISGKKNIAESVTKTDKSNKKELAKKSKDEKKSGSPTLDTKTLLEMQKKRNSGE